MSDETKCYHAGLMRALVAALALTLAIAVTASVFAIWSGVADAPWENDVDRTQEIRCQEAYGSLQASVQALGQLGRVPPQEPTQLMIIQQLNLAEREIARYC